MTKAEWISVIQNTIKQGDETGLTRAPFIERHIQSVYEQMYNELYRQDKRAMSKYTTIVTESVVTSVDLSSGRTIPTLPISLPRENGGLFQFYIGSKTFVLTSYEGYKYAANATFDTAGMKGEYFACIQKDKIYANTTTGDSVTLSYRMIPKFTALATTDEVVIPGGMEDHFIDRVIMTIKQSPPVIDQLNDNA